MFLDRSRRFLVFISLLAPLALQAQVKGNEVLSSQLGRTWLNDIDTTTITYLEKMFNTDNIRTISFLALVQHVINPLKVSETVIDDITKILQRKYLRINMTPQEIGFYRRFGFLETTNTSLLSSFPLPRAVFVAFQDLRLKTVGQLKGVSSEDFKRIGLSASDLTALTEALIKADRVDLALNLEPLLVIPEILKQLFANFAHLSAEEIAEDPYGIRWTLHEDDQLRAFDAFKEQITETLKHYGSCRLLLR